MNNNRTERSGRIPNELNPKLGMFLNYWNKKRGDRPMPTREEMDPLEIPDLLSGICILEPQYNGPKIDRVRFRLAGTSLYRMAGIELTGRYVDEVVPSPIYKRIHAQFIEVAEHLKPVFRRFEWPSNPWSGIIYERVLVPLENQDGRPKFLMGMHVIANISSQEEVRGSLEIPVG